MRVSLLGSDLTLSNLRMTGMSTASHSFEGMLIAGIDRLMHTLPELTERVHNNG